MKRTSSSMSSLYNPQCFCLWMSPLNVFDFPCKSLLHSWISTCVCFPRVSFSGTTTGSSCRMVKSACFVSCWPEVCYFRYVRHAWFFRDLMGIWPLFQPKQTGSIMGIFKGFFVIKEEAPMEVPSGTSICNGKLQEHEGASTTTKDQTIAKSQCCLFYKFICGSWIYYLYCLQGEKPHIP